MSVDKVIPNLIYFLFNPYTHTHTHTLTHTHTQRERHTHALTHTHTRVSCQFPIHSHHYMYLPTTCSEGSFVGTSQVHSSQGQSSHTANLPAGQVQFSLELQGPWEQARDKDRHMCMLVGLKACGPPQPLGHMCQSHG